MDQILSRFLDNACPDHHVRSWIDHVRAEHTALRLLDRHPEIATANFYTAVVCGDLAMVERMLSADPGWATRRNGQATSARTDAGGEGDLVKKDWGPKGWEPLSYLCFTRLSLPPVTNNAVGIARALLDHGASPNVYFMAGSSQYTPLVGAIGEGEEGRQAHQQRDALVQLLLERGADPYDVQVTYNMHFKGDVLWYLKLIYEHAQRTGRAADWADPEWRMLSAGAYGTGARWFLDIATAHGDAQLAEWCVSHGANPNAAPSLRRPNRQHSLYEEALLRGHTEVAEVLAHHGATRSSTTERPTPAPQEALFLAARYNRRDDAERVLDSGTSPNVASPQGERALHIAAYKDAVDVGELLIARGAEVDPIGPYNNTPLGGALHFGSIRMIALLARHSRSAWEVGYAGQVDRLRELLAEKPERAQGYDGETLLMYVPPDDEEKALQVATLLLQHGADPTIVDPHGQTAADRAERNAMYRVAALLRDAERQALASGL
jgi:ankyrin repeat protein